MSQTPEQAKKMTPNNNRIIEIQLYQRTRGRQYSPVSITLSQQQIDWLQHQPNASKLIRGLLDDLMHAGNEIEQKLGIISLSKQLEDVESQLSKLRQERTHYIYSNNHRWKMVEEEREIEHWEHGELKAEKKVDKHIDWKQPVTPTSMSIPKPLDNEDGQIGARVVAGYDEAISALEQKIQEIKQKILSGQ
jgi:hypothetical protein